MNITGMSLRRLIAVVLLGSSLLAACSNATPGLDIEAAGGQPADYAYVIPLGAGAALDAGTPLDILPAHLEVKVGEVIEIENLDDRGHLVGPFFVGAHETLRQQFAARGEFEGICTVHPSGHIAVVVTE